MIVHGSKGQILSKEMKLMSDENTQSSECVTKKMTPVECLKMGVAVDKAKAMALAELTKEDAEYLLQHGISKHGLSKLYNTHDGCVYPKLEKWGLHKKGGTAAPADMIPCGRCGDNFKRVELISMLGRLLCMKCADEMKKQVAPEPQKPLPKIEPLAIHPANPDSWVGEPLITGVGPDVPTEINDKGGKQSSLPYAFHLVDSKAMFALAGVLHEGAVKYERDNWRKIPAESHVNHALSHIFAWMAGDEQDQHLAHAFTRLMMGVATDDSAKLDR